MTLYYPPLAHILLSRANMREESEGECSSFSPTSLRDLCAAKKVSSTASPRRYPCPSHSKSRQIPWKGHLEMTFLLFALVFYAASEIPQTLGLNFAEDPRSAIERPAGPSDHRSRGEPSPPQLPLKGNRIVPYSQYLQRVGPGGERHDGPHNVFKAGTHGGEPHEQQESDHPTTGNTVIYLPAYANATAEHVANADPADPNKQQHYPAAEGVRQMDELDVLTAEEALFSTSKKSPSAHSTLSSTAAKNELSSSASYSSHSNRKDANLHPHLAHHGTFNKYALTSTAVAGFPNTSFSFSSSTATPFHHNPIRPQSNRHRNQRVPLPPTNNAGHHQIASSGMPPNPFIAPLPPSYLNGKGARSASASTAASSNSLDVELDKFTRKEDQQHQPPPWLQHATSGGRGGEGGGGTNDPSGQPLATGPYYSTTSSREPLQGYKGGGLFRPTTSASFSSQSTKTGGIVKQQQQKPSSPDSWSSHGKWEAAAGGPNHSQQSAQQQQLAVSSAENSLITRPSSMFQPIQANHHQHASGGSNAYYEGGGIRNSNSVAQYTKLVPAPHQSLSMAGAANSEKNIVDAIFAQSQSRHHPNPPNPMASHNSHRGHSSGSGSQVRYAPQPIQPAVVNPPPLSGSPFDLFGSAGAGGIPSGFGGGGGGGGGLGGGLGGMGNLPPLPAGLNPMELLGHGSAIEQISKLAKNLLAMGAGGGPGSGGGGGSPEFLSAVTRAIGGGGGANPLGGGAADPLSRLTSTATGATGGDVLQSHHGESPATSLIKAAIAAVKQQPSLLPIKPPTPPPKIDSVGDATNETTAGSSSNNPNSTFTASSSPATTTSNPLMAAIPIEQRSLLEAAVKNGEVDGGQLNSLLEQQQQKQGTKEAATEESTNGSNLAAKARRNGGGVIKSENRLMEWIQQNRPRTPGTMEKSSNATTSSSQQPMMLLAADKLPYYGRYCGSLVEKVETDSGRRRYNIAGAIWAVDDRRLIVSNFHFYPGSPDENITFWAGPATPTRAVADYFPSANGYYIRPEPIAVQAFLVQQGNRVASKLRSPPMEKSGGLNKRTAEQEEESDGVEVTNSTGPSTANQLRRRKRATLYEELYGSPKSGRDESKDIAALLPSIQLPTHFTSSSLRSGHANALEPNRFPQFTSALSTSTVLPPAQTSSAATIGEGVMKDAPSGGATTTSLHTPSPLLLDHLGSALATSTTTEIPTTATTTTAASSMVAATTTTTAPSSDSPASQSPSTLRIVTNSGTTLGASIHLAPSSSHQPPAPTATISSVSVVSDPPRPSLSTTLPVAATDPSHPAALEWSAGVQPLLLTLPEGHLVRNIRWISLWDHRLHDSIAFVLIPTGSAFQVPSMVQLRPLSANPSAPQQPHFDVRSGPIRVLDTKTIELTDFSLTTNGLPVWFMVGKEIMPNANGQIVPVYTPTSGAAAASDNASSSHPFDCDALRDYRNETVRLRLPGTMDIKDVFWFSVFSIPTGISLAHMYLPYNDMHLPPDLLPMPAPRCYWQPKV